MAFKTTLFAAATAAHFIQLDSRDVLRPIQIRDGKIRCCLGHDDEWTILDQEIDIDDAGTAQVEVRGAWGGDAETLMMCFMSARPLAKDDLAKAERQPTAECPACKALQDRACLDADEQPSSVWFPRKPLEEILCDDCAPTAIERNTSASQHRNLSRTTEPRPKLALWPVFSHFP